MTYIPRVGISIGHHGFDLSISKRSKLFVSANFDDYVLPGGGDFDNFFKENFKIPTLCPTPPLSGLTLIGA